MERITLQRKEPPYERDPVEALKWLVTVLGVPERFAETYAEILQRIAREGKSSGILAEEMGEKRTSLVYHINKLIAMGILVRRGRNIELRASSFERTVNEIEEDVLWLLRTMKAIAREIDEALGLPRR